jgi:predicted NAD/FAD-binding protein
LNERRRIGVIGAGISGLAAAWFLSRKHEVWVFEREGRIGGHTNTAQVQSDKGPIAVDTGFIVHNEKTYPLFCRLMRELDVPTQDSDMSFGVSSANGAFEYSSRGLNGFFAQRSNLTKLDHYLLLLEITRFNREAPEFLARSDEDVVTLGEYLAQGCYTDDFVSKYLYPMASAVWSMPQNELAEFPARTLLRFFQNHGMLGINTHPQWKTIKGGSDQYLGPLTAPFRDRILVNAGLDAVERTASGVRIGFADNPPMTFDAVVFACHGNQILPLLRNPTRLESRVLGAFETTRNRVCLHMDETLLPKREAARASWNYRIGDGARVTMTYDMNRLQALDTEEQYCVSLNLPEQVAPDAVIDQMTYSHPVYNSAAIRAQARWGDISGFEGIHYCGAWWFNGFHEDGVRSALRVAEQLGVEW